MKFLVKAAATGTTEDLINALSRQITQIEEAPIASTEIYDPDDDYEYERYAHQDR